LNEGATPFSESSVAAYGLPLLKFSSYETDFGMAIGYFWYMDGIMQGMDFGFGFLVTNLSLLPVINSLKVYITFTARVFLFLVA